MTWANQPDEELRRAAAERRGMERAARLVCPVCAKEDTPLPLDGGDWGHLDAERSLEPCYASMIWNALAKEDDQ